MKTRHTELFERHRTQLLGLSYRILGSAADASDIVQDTYLKWIATDIEAIDNPQAWLMKVTSRLSLNKLKSSHHAKVDYVGVWIPDPMVTDSHRGPDEKHEQNDNISIALMFALEKLNPIERAIFILHDVFEQKFEFVANVIEKSVENTRKIATRARTKLQQEHKLYPTSHSVHNQLVEQFHLAVEQEDLSGLVSLLNEDARMYTDSGGQVPAIYRTMIGDTSIGNFFAKLGVLIKKSAQSWCIEPCNINGESSLKIVEDGKVATVLCFQITDEKIATIYAQRNPVKLESIL
ncbi:RNA polymerase sigma factor SigJ [Vibrio nigripulchritudo]|uniref:RNA polymerase sigma factor SigJ n=1 Tax=Vibrio nigripulchritudo TaxID=28173 RepID=UPI0005FA133A|nr:RNA polymerase sigma factor SigJ [Vibrio nigripulchritudo]KJY78725.1 hypothetical protein TW74_11805 [Vibrio nigripulchritudo]